MSGPTTAETPTMRDTLVRILAAEDPRNPWDGDEPEIGAHYSTMLGAVLREMQQPGEDLIDAMMRGFHLNESPRQAMRDALVNGMFFIINETKD